MIATEHAAKDDIQAAVDGEGWEYTEADTQELTHGLHRYSGKFIPQVAARAIELTSAKGELILDPYCGSGTTLVEALRLGRRAVGVDLNPLAVLIASAKVSPVPRLVLDEASRRLRDAVEATERGDDGSLFGLSSYQRSVLCAAAADPRRTDDRFQKWFQPQVLQDLVVLRAAVDALPDERVQRAALVAFSEVLRKSSNAHSGYPNVMFDRKAPVKPRPLRPFLKAVQRTFAAVASLNEVDLRWDDARVLQGDAQHLPFETETVDAVVTHPPYIGSIPYAEYGMLSLLWLGADHRDLDARLTGGRRQSKDVIERFRTGYLGMLKECHRVLKPGRLAFVLVGNPTVRGELVDLADMTTMLARQVGFSIAATATRGGVNRRANKMGDETLIFLEKGGPRRSGAVAFTAV